MRVAYHPAALEELIEAAQFYESRVEGLGSTFLDDLEQTVARILESPEQFTIDRGSIRRAVVRRFPYGIYYRVTNDEIRILVIRHHSRHPDHGLDRA